MAGGRAAPFPTGARANFADPLHTRAHLSEHVEEHFPTADHLERCTYGPSGLGAYAQSCRCHRHEGEGALEEELADLPPVVIRSDTAALNEARIAYFIMDSVQKDYELIAEKDRRFRSEGQRLEKSLQDEMAKAQARYEQLMKKDHTYSTKAEVAKDEAELQGLMGKIQGQQANSEEQMARMEAAMLTEITNELKDYLENYNKSAGFDYIFSVQNGGQIWVGNKDLNITKKWWPGSTRNTAPAKGPRSRADGPTRR